MLPTNDSWLAIVLLPSIFCFEYDLCNIVSYVCDSGLEKPRFDLKIIDERKCETQKTAAKSAICERISGNADNFAKFSLQVACYRRIEATLFSSIKLLCASVERNVVSTSLKLWSEKFLRMYSNDKNKVSLSLCLSFDANARP